jgi:hypothetical protein
MSVGRIPIVHVDATGTRKGESLRAQAHRCSAAGTRVDAKDGRRAGLRTET